MFQPISTASNTVVVRNLSAFTTEEQLFTLVAPCGAVKRLVFGREAASRRRLDFAFVMCVEQRGRGRSG